MAIRIRGKEYKFEYDPEDKFVVPRLAVAFCEELAEDFMPIFYDTWGHGTNPLPPEFLAYRLIVDEEKKRICAIYELYWKKQECTWRELNKDHEHDYEQVQIHFSIEEGEIERVVVSSAGPVESGGHGVEIYSRIKKARVRSVEYTTSPKPAFPWGGDEGKKNSTQVREMPMEKLIFEGSRPAVEILNCYHAFAGLKRELSSDEKNMLSPPMERLDRELLEKWYYLHSTNKFGHDLSKPFDEPHLMYYPPPGDSLSRLAYGFLWLVFKLRSVLKL